MFKKAYVYGTAKALRDVGILKLAEEDLDALADAIASELPGEEEEYMEPLPEEATAELAANLIELASNLGESAENLQAGALAAAQAAESVATAPTDLEEAKNAAWNILQKLSLDAGSTATGDTTNTLADATTGEAVAEKEQRPSGYANVGAGVQEHSGEGLVGSETDRTGEGGAVVPDENSATETVGKNALWRLLNALKKHGQETGATLTAGKKTEDAGAGETLMEKERRPKDYALTGVGAPSSVSGGAIGKETPHPSQEEHEGNENSATKASEEQRYLQEIRRLGQKYASALPFYLTDIEKLAALQYLMGLSPTERTRIIHHIEKTGELPEGLREYVEKRKEEAEKAEEAKTEEEPEEEKKTEKEKSDSGEKNATLLRRLRQLNRM